jgi:hypothetical protein
MINDSRETKQVNNYLVLITLRPTLRKAFSSPKMSLWLSAASADTRLFFQLPESSDTFWKKREQSQDEEKQEGQSISSFREQNSFIQCGAVCLDARYHLRRESAPLLAGLCEAKKKVIQRNQVKFHDVWAFLLPPKETLSDPC